MSQAIVAALEQRGTTKSRWMLCPRLRSNDARLLLPYTAAGAWVETVCTSLSSLESFYLLQSITTTNGTTGQTSPQERWNSRKSQGTNNTSAHPSYQCRTASWEKDQKIYFWRKASLRINTALLFCYDSCSCSSSNCWWCRELTSSKQVRHRTALLYLYIFLLSELKNVNFDNSLEQLSHCFFNVRK